MICLPIQRRLAGETGRPVALGGTGGPVEQVCAAAKEPEWLASLASLVRRNESELGGRRKSERPICSFAFGPGRLCVCVACRLFGTHWPCWLPVDSGRPFGIVFGRGRWTRKQGRRDTAFPALCGHSAQFVSGAHSAVCSQCVVNSVQFEVCSADIVQSKVCNLQAATYSVRRAPSACERRPSSAGRQVHTVCGLHWRVGRIKIGQNKSFDTE